MYFAFVRCSTVDGHVGYMNVQFFDKNREKGNIRSDVKTELVVFDDIYIAAFPHNILSIFDILEYNPDAKIIYECDLKENPYKGSVQVGCEICGYDYE